MAHVSWAGSEELWGQTAFKLLKYGHKVSALLPFFENIAPQVLRLKNAGCEIRIKQKQNHTLWARFLRKVILSKKLTNPDLLWIKAQGADLVCISNGHYFDGLEYLEFCNSNQIDFVTIAQANAEFIWPDDSTADRIVEVFDKAKAAFFVSKANLTLAENQLGNRILKGEVVRNPYKVDWNFKLPWPVGGHPFRLACVARYEPAAKGQDLLFHVLAMNKWRERGLVVSLYGAGEMERSLRRLARLLNVESHVIFQGHVSEVKQIWQHHHCLVLPSRYEGLPLSIVEAMLCARVPIVTNVAGNAELLLDGYTGFIAKHPTIDELDNAMERAWERRDGLEEIGLCAQSVAKSTIPENPARTFAEILVQLATKIKHA